MSIDLRKVRQAAMYLQRNSESERNAFLRHLAEILGNRKEEILRANERDVREARRNKFPDAFVQRLIFDSHALAVLRDKVRSVEKLQSHLGETIERRALHGGLLIKKVRVPLGVLLVIYESRPEVTVDVAALCVKSGNAALLKGGKEAAHTNAALLACIQTVLQASGFPKETVSLVLDRAIARKLLRRNREIDVVIARGGYGLVRAVMEESTIPVLAHAAGGARIYVDKSADLKIAGKVLLNAKISKPAACNSLDTILVHEKVAKKFIPRIVQLLEKAGVRILGDAKTLSLVKVAAARASDWNKEFLGLTVAMAIVRDAQEAISFINKHGKRHTEGLVASDKQVMKEFTKSVDAAALFINASTRLHDGYVFGLGSEMGISSGKLHARGPVGLKELTTYKWEVYGKGHIR